ADHRIAKSTFSDTTLMTNTAKRLLADIRELAPDISSRAAEIEAGRRIDRQLPILVGQGERAAARCRRTADIVDEDVHTAKVIQNFADHFLDTLRGADVGLDENVGRLVFWQRGSRRRGYRRTAGR